MGVFILSIISSLLLKKCGAFIVIEDEERGNTIRMRRWIKEKEKEKTLTKGTFKK